MTRAPDPAGDLSCETKQALKSLLNYNTMQELKFWFMNSENFSKTHHHVPKLLMQDNF